MKTVLTYLAWGLAALTTQAQAQQAQPPAKGWELGAVLDLATNSRPLALGQRQQGLALGHSDLLARGPLGAHFSAQAGVAAHSHGSSYEAELEDAWLQTRSLPAGWQARAGRFASQIGALNEQHPHADDFVERPLLYRGLLGGHWFDDGLRLNWTAPTAYYLSLGAELFRGRQLVQQALTSPAVGAATLRLKLGDDWGTSHSWQWGLSYLNNRREPMAEEGHEHEEAHEEGHDSHAGHSHGALLSGRHVWMSDLAWKWAPDGNNRQQQLRLLAEFAQVSGINRHAGPGDKHRALALSAVWRFSPQWELGLRGDWLQARQPHGDHFHAAEIAEQSLMLAWKPSHAQALRLQVSTQNGVLDVEGASKRSVLLQYVLSFGAHGAHAF
ncbi:hypothetical protein HNP55_002226 [Paucibacter oligotrophus]|uniref:OmpL-like beta-barrel porin-2 n=1 Tax=Roseateles oligotrophus TaxID=1769250 RepID=A0A840LAF1_9BURK|nr:hypothetical protein [Roseateles oligotrophus]MBB4843703.1 hypothetical protein [Roseateles oligotrophus]